MQFFIKRRFEIGICLILLLAFFFRFYLYGNRWGLAHDQAAFAITARFALETRQLPLLGPFSSAGPFQTAGVWYWLVMLGTAMYPSSVLAPWVFLTFLSVGFVFLMVIVGKELGGRNFGLLLGVLSAISTAQITQSTNLTNQTPISLFSVLAILCVVKYVKTKRTALLFLLGLTIGTASSIHLQGFAILPLVLTLFVFVGLPTVKGAISTVVGGVIPWLAVLYIDLQNGFFNTRNMFYYFFFEKNKPSFEVLGRRWLTFTSEFVPHAWSHIIGGYLFIGYVLVIAFLGLITTHLVKKKLFKEILLIALSTVFMFAILRYTRTPLFESFFVFLHPFIIILTGWIITATYAKKAFLGFSLFLAVAIGSIRQDVSELIPSTNRTPNEAFALATELIGQFPKETFSVYDYQFRTTKMSLPLVLFLSTGKKAKDDGRRIGISNITHSFPVLSTREGYQVFDLNGVSKEELGQRKWGPVGPKEVYESSQKWYLKP